MTKEQQEQKAQAVVDFRYSIIAELLNPYLSRTERRALMREKANRQYEVPYSNRTRLTVECIKKWYAAFGRFGKDGLQGCAWIEALTGEKDQPVVSLNQYCLEHRVNGVCLTRYTIHLFRENTPRVKVPHNPGVIRIFKMVIDSW